MAGTLVAERCLIENLDGFKENAEVLCKVA